ncbi:hypothetical protein M0R45_026313 [Rubus argutus]|uniref:Uncharacterized protein n=1 Tax=Rubus argutus TaxID=59490 RepID=A0AAW1X0M0_RUBAR
MAEEGLDENVPCEESGTLEPSNVNGNGEAAQQSPTVQNDEDDDKDVSKKKKKKNKSKDDNLWRVTSEEKRELERLEKQCIIQFVELQKFIARYGNTSMGF